MVKLPLESLIGRITPGHNAHLLGPEVSTPAPSVDAWRPGRLIRCASFDFHLARGPARLAVHPRVATWSLVTPVLGTVDVALADVATSELLAPGDVVLLAPGATAHFVLERAAWMATLSAPPRDTAPLTAVADEAGLAAQGLSWLIRRADVERALEPRDKVKVAEGNLWRPQATPGLWRPGTEILCEAMAFGMFRTGAPESAHQHRRTWELYHVLDGTLRLNVRDHRLGPWTAIEVAAQEALLLPPGTAHLVEQDCRHLSLTFQAPPSIADREIVSYTPGQPSLGLPFSD